MDKKNLCITVILYDLQIIKSKFIVGMAMPTYMQPFIIFFPMTSPQAEEAQHFRNQDEH